jgi:hypothetical protein
MNVIVIRRGAGGARRRAQTHRQYHQQVLQRVAATGASG